MSQVTLIKTRYEEKQVCIPLVKIEASKQVKRVDVKRGLWVFPTREKNEQAVKEKYLRHTDPFNCKFLPTDLQIN